MPTLPPSCRLEGGRVVPRSAQRHHRWHHRCRLHHRQLHCRQLCITTSCIAVSCIIPSLPCQRRRYHIIIAIAIACSLVHSYIATVIVSSQRHQ